jgi:hypothetical protein
MLFCPMRDCFALAQAKFAESVLKYKIWKGEEAVSCSHDRSKMARVASERQEASTSG